MNNAHGPEAKGGMDAMDRLEALRRELRNCRNELCYRCGAYTGAHEGACDHCRYRTGGEWEELTA